MTPREELLRVFDTLVDNYHASRQETRAMLNQYAIGRWVSVEERLPHVGFMGMVKHKTFGKGLMRMTHDRVGSFFNEKCSAGVSVKDEITHWLDLDLPSGKEEA